MADNKLDEVFLLLSVTTSDGLPVLQWAMDHFDKEKTKFIFANCYVGASSFRIAAENVYRPTCKTNKIESAIVMPQAIQARPAILELITKHKMKKLFTWEYAWNYNKLSEWFDENPTLSCKIWVVSEHTGKLVSVRDTGLHPGRSATPNDMEKLLLSENFLHNATIEQHPLIQQICVLTKERNNLREELDKLKQEQINQAEELHRINEQKWNDAKESMKKENELLQHKLDNAVKEVEKLRILAQTSDFTWQELNKATQDFSESSKIGKGGFGCVYKGNLRGTEVAIKTLNSQSTIPLSGFKQEVAILTTVRHPNLVTLIGACYETSALIYEFLPNGSLEKYLSAANNITPLTWQQLARIISEICLALIFLHSNKPNMVIHGDLKPDNILLDANFVSKLADFGISRLIKKTDTNITQYHFTGNPAGTPGYMDPDYVITGKLTEKSDVFSFGVIILRLVTGEPVMGLVNRVKEAKRNQTLDKMIAVSAGEWPFDQVNELVELALMCVKMESSDRPNLFNDVWPIVERLCRNI